MQLTTIAKVRARFALPVDSKVDAAITAALDGATPVFENRLGSVVASADYVDTFYIDSNIRRAVNGFYRLRATARFVDPDTVVITYGDTFSLRTETALTDYVLKADRGHILVADTLADKFFSVSYSAGYSKADNVPLWLQEAVVSYCGILMSIHDDEDGSAEVNATNALLQSHVDATLAPYLQHGSVAIPPI